jgi:hypothetical protein
VGYRIVFGGHDMHGTAENFPWGKDERDYVVVKMRGGNFYVATVDRRNTHSGRVRLVSAFKVPKAKVLELAKKEGILSSTDVLKLLHFGQYVNLPSYADPVRVLLLSGMSKEEAINDLVSCYHFDLKLARKRVSEWLGASRIPDGVRTFLNRK